MKTALKCLLTGIIYAAVTAIVQVPIASLLFKLLRMKPDDTFTVNVPLMLSALVLTGIGFAYFYYETAAKLQTNSKLTRGLIYGLFLFFSNYFPQVAFLSANHGLSHMIHGGFPVYQVMLFDFVILIITSLIMSFYMPIKKERTPLYRKNIFVWYIIPAAIFALTIFALNEYLLPLFGIANMTKGLAVEKENLVFFYSFMLIGFILSGVLVIKYGEGKKALSDKIKYCLFYGLIIWCLFDTTMPSLGMGLLESALFIIISALAFLLMALVWHLIDPSKRSIHR